MNPTSRQTCDQYRSEMMLAVLQKRLAQPDLPAEEKEALQAAIKALKSLLKLV